jgi:SARP family transcriptional regulator, regulator of embCAB operon
MKVFIVDDSPAIRSALGLFLSQTPGWVVSGEAANLLSGLAELGQVGQDPLSRPDVILLDTEIQGLPPGRQSHPYRDLVRLLEQVCPGAALIGWSAHELNKQAALEAGMGGFVCKSDPPETILAALERVVAER